MKRRCLLTLLGFVAACGSHPDSRTPRPEAPEAGGATFVVIPPPLVVQPDLQLPSCPAGTTTTLRGTAYAPNGVLPLSNVLAYVPSTALEPLPKSLTCDRCGAPVSGQPIAVSLTDAHGAFQLHDVPAGTNVPLVLQIGKWRREVRLPNVTACVDNTLNNPELTRLPRNRSEGNLPHIAVSTGSCDNLACLLPRIGVDLTELGVSGDDTAVTYFQGENGTSSAYAAPGAYPVDLLVEHAEELAKYDLLLWSCRCGIAQPPSSQAVDNLRRYLTTGGRFFGSHLDDFLIADYATFFGFNDPVPAGALSRVLTLNDTFAKGKLLADWLRVVEPQLTQLEPTTLGYQLKAVSPETQVWATAGGYPHVVTTNVPVAAPSQQCGRVAHLDLHVTGTEDVTRSATPGKFPEGCGTTLSAEESLLAFLFFDTGACLQDDAKATELPPVK